MQRPGLRLSVPLPASLARRDRRADSRFDVARGPRAARAVGGFPGRPRIVSSAHGPLGHLMLWYPPYAADEFSYVAVYRSLFRSLPATTRLSVVTHPDVVDELAALLRETRPAGTHDVIVTPRHLLFTVWAEDAFVVVDDVSVDPAVTYLVEPRDFPRSGDLFLAEIVGQSVDIATSQVPLTFQGGNILIGDDFVLVGRDYLDDSIALLDDPGTTVRDFPSEGSPQQKEAFVRALFRETFDPDRAIHFLASTPRSRPRNRFVERDGATWLDDIAAGRGRRQPIFHIDMFVSLAGRNPDTGAYRILVGSPAVANDILGWDDDADDLQAEYDQIAAQLSGLGFEVLRTPLPHTFVWEPQPGVVPGPQGDVQIAGTRSWYHATSNNCLVRADPDVREVWLPTYGHGDMSALSACDDNHERIWTELGFRVHRLADFNAFASRQGALHCIKKYLHR